MKPPHFLCTFRRRMDASGKIYYSATLGNSRLLLYPTAEGEMALFLGGQIMPEKKSLQDDLRGANGRRADIMDGMK